MRSNVNMRPILRKTRDRNSFGARIYSMGSAGLGRRLGREPDGDAYCFVCVEGPVVKLQHTTTQRWLYNSSIAPERRVLITVT